MTFQQLTYVVEISRCGSINKAAHKLLLSQSGISAAVRELETELGISFFIRSNRGVEWTPEGKEFLGYAISLLEQKQRIEQLYSGHRGSNATVFSVATQRYPFTEDAFLRLLGSMGPSPFQISIQETGMDAVIDSVYQRRADIGVIFLTELTEKIICRLLSIRELAFHELAAVPPSIYVRRGHPLVHQSTITEDVLEGYPYICFDRPQGVSADFSEECQMVSLYRPAQCVVVDNRSTALNVLARTDGFTTGSGLLVRDISNPQILSLPLAEKEPIRLGWIYPENTAPTPLAQQFVTFLGQALADSIAYTRSLREAIM